jgi:hypothetical protein
MQTGEMFHESARGSDRYFDLSTAIEDLVTHFIDAKPKLERAGFRDCAQKLQHHITLFDFECAPPHVTDGVTAADLKVEYDKSAATLARMCGLLYQQVHEHCSFGAHYDLITHLMSAMREFNKVAPRHLKQMGLEYHEFDSLTLELEAKLGLDAPRRPVEEAPSERRRNMAKNPQKIETALKECIETARAIRPQVTNGKNQQKLDKIIGDVSSILGNLPTGDDEESQGKRIAALISASAKILKVGKWIRKVDLLETQPSESVKREILRRFDDLASLSRGQEPGQGRH